MAYLWVFLGVASFDQPEDKAQGDGYDGRHQYDQTSYDGIGQRRLITCCADVIYLINEIQDAGAVG